MDQFDARLVEISEQIAQLLETARAHERRMNHVEGRIANLEGGDLEHRYGEHYRDWLADHLVRTRRVYVDELELLDAGLSAGILTREEVRDVRYLDLLLRGTLPDGSGRESLLALEISYTINADDVERVVARADVLRRAGYPVIALVGGYRVEPATEALARSADVAIDLHRPRTVAVA